MRILLALLLALIAMPAAACEVGAPYDWKSKLPCSAKAQKLMERMGGCQHFGGEEPYDDARRKFINDAVRDLGCRRLGCDFHALKSPRDKKAVAAYVKEYYGSVREFNEAVLYPQSCRKK